MYYLLFFFAFYSFSYHLNILFARGKLALWLLAQSFLTYTFHFMSISLGRVDFIVFISNSVHLHQQIWNVHVFNSTKISTFFKKKNKIVVDWGKPRFDWICFEHILQQLVSLNKTSILRKPPPNLIVCQSEYRPFVDAFNKSPKEKKWYYIILIKQEFLFPRNYHIPWIYKSGCLSVYHRSIL